MTTSASLVSLTSQSIPQNDEKSKILPVKPPSFVSRMTRLAYNVKDAAYDVLTTTASHLPVMPPVNLFGKSKIPTPKQSITEAPDIAQLEKQAGLGDFEALSALGECYAKGTGVIKDPAKAFDLFCQAALGGSPGGYARRARCLEWGEGVRQDLAEAMKSYGVAVEKKNGLGLALFGHASEIGHGVKQNSKAALDYYTASAALQCPEGQYFLGLCYLWGKCGVNQSTKKGLELLSEAAREGGYSLAQNTLADIYMTGLDVKQDTTLACALYWRAAKQANTRAMRNFSDCLREGIGIKQNIPEAIRWMSKATELGDIDAEITLALWYESGYFGLFPKTLPRARELYKDAASRGDIRAKKGLERVEMIISSCAYYAHPNPSECKLP
jgi:TPR repeat protein